MPTIGDLFKTEVIEWRGRKLTLARASFATEAAFRDTLEKEALAAIQRNAPGMTGPMLKMQMAAWQEACATHVYDYGTEAWAKAMDSRQHRCRWFWLVFSQPGLDGKPIPEPVSLTEIEDRGGLWDEKGDDIAAAWQRLNAPPGTADPQKPPAPDKTAAAA